MKTKEELKQSKTEYEISAAELNEAELKPVVGGTGAEGYKYCYRMYDYVYMSSDKRYRFVVDENVDTNDDGCVINGHRVSSGAKERDVSYLTLSVSRIVYY